MKVAVDTSALVRLAWREAGADAIVDTFRKMGRPALIVSDLLLLETETAIRAKAFSEKRLLARTHHGTVSRVLRAAVARFHMMRERGMVSHVNVEWSHWMDTAKMLALKWAESHGARTMDILHLAFALCSECDFFFTCDERQATMARSEGLKVLASA